jgi:hypothetical protein
MTFSLFHLLVHVLNECKDLEYLLQLIKRGPLVRQNYKLLSHGTTLLSEPSHKTCFNRADQIG